MYVCVEELSSSSQDEQVAYLALIAGTNMIDLWLPLAAGLPPSTTADRYSVYADA